MIYDITRTISPSLKVWPGDTPFSYEQKSALKQGAPVNLTTLTLSAHTGTHMDAYWHYIEGGEHPAQTPIEPYIGPARVISVERKTGGITPADLSDVDLTGTPRVLLHTWVSGVPDDTWPEGFPYPTLELVSFLAEQGVIMLGVDSPSMDPQDSKDLPCHHSLYEHNMRNLEFLMLDNVPDGVYELVALPLKIDEICGTPVRAILRSMTQLR
jgi:arylformamidase